MVEWLENVAEALLGRWSLRDAQLFLDALQRAATTAAILVGGSWAYMKFVRGRTFKLRLEPSVTADVWRGPEPEAALYLVADCRAINAGLSRFRISAEDSALQLFTSATPGLPAPDDPETGVKAERVGWEELGAYPVFEESARTALEPAEHAQDEILFELPGDGPAALKLVLTVTATSRTGRSWTVTRVVRLAQAVDNTQRTVPPGQEPIGPEVDG